MTRYDTARLAALVSALSTAGSTTARGRRLQELTSFLIEPLPGVEITAENIFNIGRTEEKDLWLQHAREAAGMPFDDREFPVECKNEKDKTGPEAIAWFAEKIKNSGGRDGLLFTVAGLQRLKAQGLRRRIEGQSGLSEERVDEVGPALDGPEPAADDGLELVEGGGGVVAQAAFHD
jgi:hypothetical protein